MFECTLGDDGQVVFEGRFDASQVEKAEAVLSTVSDDCVIDCQNLDYVSSAGIGVIIATYKRLYDQGKTLKLVNPNEYIRKLFHYAGLTKLFGMD